MEPLTIMPVSPIKLIIENIEMGMSCKNRVKMTPAAPKGMTDITISGLKTELRINDITKKVPTIAIIPADIKPLKISSLSSVSPLIEIFNFASEGNFFSNFCLIF